MAADISMTPVSSSNLKAIGYDQESGTLRVAFHNGHIYEYFNVRENIYLEFMSARSKGKYLNSYIRDNFSYDQII